MGYWDAGIARKIDQDHFIILGYWNPSLPGQYKVDVIGSGARRRTLTRFSSSIRYPFDLLTILMELY